MDAGLRDDAVIRTPDQRLRVFVSSTLAELAEERQAVARAIAALGLTPVLFESGARPHPPQELYRAYLGQCDIFIGLYWQSYGQVGPGMQVSGLEEELELSKALPRLLYLKAPAPDRDPRLTALLSRIRQQASYRRFSTPAELDQLVRDDLATLLSERFAATSRSLAHGPAVPMDPGRRSLPAATTSLFGREQAIDQVAGLFGRPEVRLVTLTGPGGVGKTRLALAVAERLGDGFDATAFVPLAGVTQSEVAMATVCRATGADLAGTGSPLDVLVERLGDSRWLLILDNLEQVIEVARDLDHLLTRCREVAILATSMTVLRLRAEREYPVPPLSLPSAVGAPVEDLTSSPAVALFVDRARAVRHDFTLTAGNAAAVVEICRRLEGLPLAIELAAARTRLLEPDALLRRLATSLDALGTGTVDMPARHHTLRATVEWSVDLLDEVERSLLETMAVFVDGWTVEAAAQVAGLDEAQALDLTEALARHSLVALDRTANGPRPRMLETVREFVAERLTARRDFDEVQRRHADYYRALAERADRPLRGGGHREWLALLQVEAGNLAAAVAWYLAHDPTPLPHLFRVLWTFWELQDRVREGRAWVEQLLPTADSLDAQPRVELLWTELVSANDMGDDAAALAARGRLEPLIEGIQDPFLHAATQLVIAWTAPIVGDYDGALRGELSALERLRGQDEPYWTALALGSSAFMETDAGRYDDAVGHMREARDLADGLDNGWLSAIARVWLGTLALMRDRPDEARVLLDEALHLSLATHSTITITLCLAGIARLALTEGDAERAALLTGAADGLRRRAGLRLWPPLRRCEAQLAAQVRQALAPRFDRVFAAGARLNLHEAVAAVRDRRLAGVRAPEP